MRHLGTIVKLHYNTKYFERMWNVYRTPFCKNSTSELHKTIGMIHNEEDLFYFYEILNDVIILVQYVLMLFNRN